jgi:cell division transport system permease protein
MGSSTQKNRMKKTRNKDSFFSTHLKEAKLSFINLWRRPIGNILTLAVIAMAFSLPASIYLVGKNIAEVGDGISQNSKVSAYLQEGLPEARIMVLKDELEGLPNVKSVQYISAQQGLDDLSRYSGFDQAISLLDGYALPAILVVRPMIDDGLQIKTIAEALKAQALITDIRLDEDWLARLDAMRKLANTVAVTLSALMLGAVFLIVGNTLRFTVLAHKEEIQVMKLIGATDGFILRPYLYSGMWFGLIGAIFAWILTAIITILINGAVEELALLYDSEFRLIGLNIDESTLLIMLGIFLGYTAASLSARRHLKDIEPV